MKKVIKLCLLIALTMSCNVLLSQRADNTSRSWEINDLDWGIESGHDEGSTQSQIILDGENDAGGSILLEAGDGPLGAGNITLGYPDNGSILFQQNGATLMTLTNSNIGIGNSEPGHTLDITGNMNITGNIFQNNELLDFSGLWSHNNDNIYFNSGNVGIGNDNPSYSLDVSGDIRYTGNLYRDDNLIDLDEGTWTRDGDNKVIESININGAHDYTCSISLTKTEIGGYGDDIILKTGNGYFGSGKVIFSSNSYAFGLNEMTYVDGRLGIGITPAWNYKLDVDGSVNIKGDLYHNGSRIDLSGGGIGDWSLNNGDIYRLDGNVGIGISSPHHKLTVSANKSGYTYINVDNGFTPGTGVGSGIAFTEGGGMAWYLRSERDYSGNFNIGSHTGNKFTIHSSGKVGVGFENPYSRLHVGGTIGLHGDGLDGSAYQLAMFYANADLGLYFDAPLNANDERLPIQFNWRGGGTPALYISGDGDVGIGTNDPHGHKLAVAGSIITEEIWVKPQANWHYADFVFKDDYKLKSLNEVESFIEEYGHLPDVPSEAEVMETGINLQEMNVVLLQKIEELTLYLIEQNKTIEKLVEENKSLNNKE